MGNENAKDVACPGVDPALDASSSRHCEPLTLAEQLRRSLNAITRRMRSQRGEAELPEGQHSVLSALLFHGPMTPGGLADHEFVKPPPMTRTINVLAEAGLVEKHPHPTDGRQTVVELTERGRADVLETRRKREQWLADQLGQLSADDQAAVRRTAEILAGLGE